MLAFEGLEHLGRVVVMGHQFHQLTIEPEHRTHARHAQAHRAGNDGVEHRLDVGRRPADHAQYIARCGLLFQRLGQFAGAQLDLALDQIERIEDRIAGIVPPVAAAF